MHPKGRGGGTLLLLLLLLPFLALLALGATDAHLVPRLSFQKGDPRRLVSSFSHSGVQNYDVFLLSPDGDTLFVGARDAILALDITRPGDIRVKGEIPWSPPASKKEECVFKKKSNETECFNFLRVLVPLNASHLYACGTFAFSPTCAFLDLANFTLVSDAKGHPLLQEGKGLCPFDPRHQNTATVVDGELYAGTMNNFQGNEPIISRTLGTRTPLKTDSFLTWLHPDASFVGSFSPAAFDPEAEGKVYFFFSETGKEFDFFERLTVPRVARVCKNDVGGDKVLQKKWTTFLKAGLSCSQGNGHFPFTLLRHVAPLHQAQGGPTLLYGAFASQWQGGSSSPSSSAVCAFSLSSIQRAFEGKYKELNKDCSRWVTYSGPPMEPRPGSCGVGPSSDKALTFMKDHFLMEERVAPVLGRPLLVAQGPPYSRLALHTTRLANGKAITVLFLGTEGGFLHKAVSLEGGQAHIVEEVQLFERPEPVRNLLLDPKKGRLFVGHSEGVLEVPLANCSQHLSCAQCVLARDPFCAWDGTQCRDITREGEGGHHQGGGEPPQNRTQWAQDVEGGHPEPLCPPSTAAKGRSGPRTSHPMGLPVTELRGPLHSLVRLPCPRASALANYSWTLPAATPPSAALVVSEEEAGGVSGGGAGGGLVVLVGREALGPFTCWASENGFRHPVALFRVLPSSSSSSSSEDADRPELSGAAGKGHRSEPMSRRRSYWVQFVTVTVLLAVTLTVAAALGFFSFYEAAKARSKVRGVEGAAAPEGGGQAASGQEKAPLNGNDGHGRATTTKSCCVQVDIDAENNRLTADNEEDGEAKHVAAVDI
nr:semaphorin-4A [Anolis sagrei ordinatus]